MEAGSTSHYWSRKLLELIPLHEAKQYVKSQKYDLNDALAITETVPRQVLNDSVPEHRLQMRRFHRVSALGT